MEKLGEKFVSRVKSWGIELYGHKKLIILSLLFLGLAIILEYISGNYVDKAGGVEVTDLFLDLLPPTDLSYLFVYGFILIFLFMFLYPLFFKVHQLHKVISQFSLLVIIRSIFICLTHLKLPTDAILPVFPGGIQNFAFGNDLFFSGHVAVPFLGFLIFENKKIKYFFLAMSVIMAITVLSMHLHYSIDVFAAFFITYGSYKMGQVLFRNFEKKT
ncbi:MAG: phosphatase PAP2-related protein [Candidatus Pacearchaeota archaeon]|jgi:hypothetical protein